MASAFRTNNTFISRICIRSDFSKFCLYWIAFITLCLVAFVIAALHLTVKPMQFQAPTRSLDDILSPDVSLTAEVTSVDPISRIIVMNWYPELTSINCSSEAAFVTDIYLSATLLDTSSPSWTAQPADTPAFRMNSTQICLNLIIPNPSFRTVTKLIASKENLELQKIAEQSTIQSYPFDVYLAPFLLYTRNVETGVISALKISDSFGIAVNFEISLLSSEVNYNALEQNLLLYLIIRRARATVIFVIVVAVTNWLTATAFLTISAATLVYRPHKIYAEMFVVPVGALFAFTSIRANLPGAPAGFGATIDLFTILPVLIIMSFCSFSLLLIILCRRISQETVRGDKDDCDRNGTSMEEGMAPVSLSLNLPHIPPLPPLLLPFESSIAEERDDNSTEGNYPACRVY
ncbi:hypothetical protein BYT27DRAFT_7194475 [Phlegmacium glaucopus]|nr:hypothetical protein BYT27DRAFT_7194475 [Phlegmacium glaucopus]